MQKRFALLLFFGLLLFLRIPKAHACGHEGWYGGIGYGQLFQFSPDKRLTAGGGSSANNVSFKTRYGGYAKIGYDWCGTRYGIEFPFSYNRQRLNRQNMIHLFGMDVNAVIHLVETEGGADFYWIAGTGMNIVPRDVASNTRKAVGINLNFGPGFQYFISKKPRVALGVSVPLKYTLYFGSNLSARKTQVIGVPFLVGFTVGF